jgi:hypothetical protein
MGSIDHDAVSSWAPDDETGLVRWFKPRDQGLSDNDPIVALTDYSPELEDATQGTSGFRAVYKANIINGHGVARFDGSDDVYTVGDLSSLTAGHVFIVVKLDADPPPSGDGLWYFGTGSANRYPFGGDGAIYENWGSNTRYNGIAAGPLDQWRTYSIHSATNDWEAKLDGSSLSTQNPNTVAFFTACVLGDGGVPNFLDGDILEMFIYDHKLSSGAEADALAYCAALIAP